MSTERIFDDPALEALRKKYFPRVPWTGAGPVRRRYLAKAVGAGQTVAGALEALALAEGFIAPSGHAVTGGPETCLAALWCDLALGPADADGWQEMIVRSEEAENLVALAHAVGAAWFRKV